MIKFSGTLKLFLVILATCIAVVFSMGMAVRWNFERGFVQYVQERNAELVDRLQGLLADLYVQNDNWDALRSNDLLWNQLMVLRSNHAGEETTNKLPSTEQNTLQENRPRGSGLPPPRPSPYTLLDASGQYVAGLRELSPEAARHAIHVGGNTVGWLVTPIAQRLPDGAARRFQAQQASSTLMISLVSVLLAAIVSLLLARIFIAPLKKLTLTTRRLTAGDYSARMRVRSSDELGQLTHDFNTLAGTLEHNEQLRRNLLADISHELRTPLAILRGELEGLQDGVRELNQQALGSLLAEVGLLSKLINDLRELSLAEAGAMTYRMQNVNVTTLLTEAVASFAGSYRANNITLSLDHIDGTPTIQGDAQRLTQVFNNLLENSLRYTDAGGQLHITTRQTNGTITLDFQDSAPSVPPDMLPRLFERLFRTDESRNRESGGSGLGLAICQSIVQAHGGTIQALPTPLGGICIRITLPRTPGQNLYSRSQLLPS